MPVVVRSTTKFEDCALSGLFYFQRVVVTLGFDAVTLLTLDRGVKNWREGQRSACQTSCMELLAAVYAKCRGKTGKVGIGTWRNSKGSKLEKDFNTLEKRKYHGIAGS